MKKTSEPEVNLAAVEKANRHMDHHGGQYERWYVGIEEEGSDRNTDDNRHPLRFRMVSDEEAKLTMSWLLGMGLMADDEYGAEPTVLFIYTRK